MNRAIYSLLALATCAVPVACSSSGDSSGPVIRQTGFSQSPPPDPNLPATGSDLPPPDPNLAASDPNLPPPDPNTGSGSIGSSNRTFVPTEGFCGSLCDGVEERCRGACRGQCAAYLVFYTRCPAQVGAAAACVQQSGFTCDDQNNLRLANPQCEPLVTALITCGTSQNPNPLPTATGIPDPIPTDRPNEPPPLPIFDGGR